MTDFTLTTDSGRRTALRRMLLIRRFEEKTSTLFADGEIPGFVHLYIGQEAVAVGTTAALSDGDHITSTHRGHGHCVALGLNVERMFAELMGKADGFNGGKGGSMHIADVNGGMLGANGIVGSGAPLATGAGLTKHHRGEDSIGLAYFGDGGVSQGQVHESINLAAAWNLPVVYVIEKNHYVENMPASSVFNHLDYEDFATTFDIPGTTVDGMDVEAVADAVGSARQRAIDGDGPSIVVAETYRFVEHSEGTPDDRPLEERDSWEDRDPIAAYRDRLLEDDVITEASYEDLVEAVDTEIDDAARAAATMDDADPGAAYEDVFTEQVPDINYHRSTLGGK